jgi:Rps23 Pro-64 3,4-dihydroxylase Tpa1-like proline 4-hydroxylase
MLQARQEAAEDRLFHINPELDLAALRRAYQDAGRVRIYGLLDEGAVELYEHLVARTDWLHAFATDRGVVKLTATEKAGLSAKRWREMEAQAHERSRRAFQYRYEAVRLPQPEEATGDDPLCSFARFLHGGSMTSFLESVTGLTGFTFSEGQATAFGSGDFLTGHDDGVEGRGRLAAMVFGLTPQWRPDYGGLLIFPDDQDRSFCGNVPRFNSLDIFRVPMQHSVSIVTPAAPHRRVSITGWLSSGGGFRGPN